MSILRVLVAGLCCFSCSYVSIAQTCENIAVGYPTRVSSNQGGSLGGYATDGRMDTRWESQFSDPQWLVVDLGVAHTICEAVIRWEHASARDFSVDISSDSVTWTNVATISNNLEYVNRISITGSARYFRLNGTARTTGFGYSIYELEIHGIPPANCGETNLALNRPSTASSVGNPVYVKENAFDGDLATRWESAFSDPQFIAVDLGAVYSVCRIDLLWEDAYARDFQIQFSTDGTQWQTAASYIENASRRNSLSLSGSARYVRIFGTRRATNYGYSLYEVAIFGTSGALPAVFGTLTGTIVPGGISLEWEILQETDVAKYSIERRENTSGIFREIGTIASLGNGQVKKTYHFTDPNPATGANFYRIKILDIDKSYSLSKELRVQFNAGKGALRYIAESRKIIVSKSPGLRRVQLLNSAGVLQQTMLQLSAAGAEIRLNSIVPGVYILQFIYSDGRREARSIYLR